MSPDEFTTRLQAIDPLIDAANAARNSGDHETEAYYLEQVEHHMDRLDAARQGGTSCGRGL